MAQTLSETQTASSTKMRLGQILVFALVLSLLALVAAWPDAEERRRVVVAAGVRVGS